MMGAIILIDKSTVSYFDHFIYIFVGGLVADGSLETKKEGKSEEGRKKTKLSDVLSKMY